MKQHPEKMIYIIKAADGWKPRRAGTMLALPTGQLYSCKHLPVFSVGVFTRLQ